MSDTIITFRTTTGVYAKAIKPYKKWYHSSDMSKKIEIDGRYYRVVRTTGLINKLRLKKMVVCDENGQIVEDEEVTRQCFKWMMYLDRKSTRLNSSHVAISYAVFCLKKKIKDIVMSCKQAVD